MIVKARRFPGILPFILEFGPADNRSGEVWAAGMIYHALNRANFRARLFRETAHDEDRLGTVEEALNFVPIRILAYCLMPNHGRLVLLYPRADGDLSKFLQRITLPHRS